MPHVLDPDVFHDSLATSRALPGIGTCQRMQSRGYIVRLSQAERETLEAFIRTGKRPAAQVLKARILLKADISEAGEGWSDRRIVIALDTSLTTVSRTRQLLFEEGFDAVLRRKQSPNSARRRIFDAPPRPS